MDRDTGRQAPTTFSPYVAMAPTMPHRICSIPIGLTRPAGGWIWAAFGLLALCTAPPVRAWVVDQQSTVNISGSNAYANTFEILDLPIIDISPSIGVNLGLVKGSASGHADIDARFVFNSDSSFDLASQASARTFMFTPVFAPTVGDSFFLVNQIDSAGIQKLNIQTGNFYAVAGLMTDLGGSASGSACAGFCVNASLKLKVDGMLDLATIDSKGLSVFGSLVDSGAPYSFSGFDGLASASASVPTFSKTFSNLAPGQAAVYDKQQSVLAANLDVAALVAKAAGFPIPLKGDLLGFGYELLSLDAFAGLNLQHALTFNVLGLNTVYEFSSPVEVFQNGAWSAPFTTLTLGDNEAVELRSTGATSIGITRSYEMGYKVDYDFDLLLNAGVDLSALELHGLGLSLGPLIDPAPWEINLGNFDIDSGSKTGKLVSKGGTTNVSFAPIKYITDASGTPVPVDLCAAIPGGCDKTGYVTERADLGDLVLLTTRRVLNFGDAGCDGIVFHDCVFDADFAPIVRQARSGDPGTPSRDGDLLALLAELGFADGIALPGPDGILEFAEDYGWLGAYLAEAPLLEGPASSPELLLAALRELGVDPDDPFPPRQPLTGAPPEALLALTEDLYGSIDLSVPEPSTWALFAVTGLAFGIARRRAAA